MDWHERYFFPFFLPDRFDFGCCCGGTRGMVIAGAVEAMTVVDGVDAFFILDRASRSCLISANRDASMAPSFDFALFPPAAPIPNNPSTNTAGSNYYEKWNNPRFLPIDS